MNTPPAETCCVCGSETVTYHNYRGRPFCGPCADGPTQPSALDRILADADHHERCAAQSQTDEGAISHSSIAAGLRIAARHLQGQTKETPVTDKPEGRALTMAEINAQLRVSRCSPACSEQHTYRPPCQATRSPWAKDGRHGPSPAEVSLQLNIEQPAERCGNPAPRVGGGIWLECVLQPGHQGSHADNEGARWTTKPAAGYCPHCGRGDAGPTAEQYEASQRRAIRIQTLLDETRDRVRKLHRPTTAYGRPEPICAECSSADDLGSTDGPPVDYPCSTITALQSPKETPDA